MLAVCVALSQNTCILTLSPGRTAAPDVFAISWDVMLNVIVKLETLYGIAQYLSSSLTVTFSNTKR